MCPRPARWSTARALAAGSGAAASPTSAASRLLPLSGIRPRERFAMTSLDRRAVPAARADGAKVVRSLLTAEFAETLKLATPIALTQLGQIAMMTTDLALIGRLGTDAV